MQNEKLKVLLLCNNAFVKGNGLCTAIRAMKERLRAEGVDARLIAAVNEDAEGGQPDFPLGHFVFPVFEPIIYANGFRYARYDRKQMREAIAWADVVHLQEAFPIEIYAIKIARELGKPVVGTFHLFPENITANLGIGKWSFVSNAILYFWRRLVYDKCSHIQCPTAFVKQHLENHKFRSELRVISNGIDMDGVLPPAVETSCPQAPYRVLCIGRLSNEKGQMTLLKAMRHSRHAKDILLQFAGKGPYFKKYSAEARKLYAEGVLAHMPEFGFYGKEELSRMSASAYLYIHCAWVEVEGLSCIEALREGAVPVIAEGAVSATSQFALDGRSRFPVFDAKALAGQIDWWIEHPEEHAVMRAAYAKSASRYDQRESTRQLIEMYRDALK